MEITREAVKQRLEGLRLGEEDLLRRLHATSGAIQEAEYWLSVLEAEPQEASNGSQISSRS